jgi:hypothetical protein
LLAEPGEKSAAGHVFAVMMKGPETAMEVGSVKQGPGWMYIPSK